MVKAQTIGRGTQSLSENGEDIDYWVSQLGRGRGVCSLERKQGTQVLQINLCCSAHVPALQVSDLAKVWCHNHRIDDVKNDDVSDGSTTVYDAEVVGVSLLESYPPCFGCKSKVVPTTNKFGACNKCDMPQRVDRCN